MKAELQVGDPRSRGTLFPGPLRRLVGQKLVPKAEVRRTLFSLVRPGRYGTLAFTYAAVYFGLLLSTVGQTPLLWDEASRTLPAVLFLPGKTAPPDGGDFFTVFSRFNPVNPPLYSLLTWIVFATAGVSVLTVRIVTVFFAAATLFLTFKLVSLSKSEKQGVIAMIVLSAFPGFYAYSRVATLDVPVTFFIIAAVYLFERHRRLEGNIQLLMVGVLLGLGILMKYDALLLVPILFLLVSSEAERQRGLRVVGLVSLVGGSIAYPWLARVALDRANIFAVSQHLIPGLDDLGNALNPYWTFYYIVAVFLLMGVVGGFLGFAGMIAALRRRVAVERLGVFCVLVFVVFFSLTPLRYSRYLVPTLPVFASLTTGLLVSVWNRGVLRFPVTRIRVSGRVVAAVLVAGLIATNVWTGFGYGQSVGSGSRLEEAVRYVGQNIHDKDALLVLFPSNETNYYTVRFLLLLNRYADVAPIYTYPERPVDAFASEEMSYDRVIWIVRNLNVQFVMAYEGTPVVSGVPSPSGFISGLISTGEFDVARSLGEAPNRFFILRPYRYEVSLWSDKEAYLPGEGIQLRGRVSMESKPVSTEVRLFRNDRQVNSSFSSMDGLFEFTDSAVEWLNASTMVYYAAASVRGEHLVYSVALHLPVYGFLRVLTEPTLPAVVYVDDVARSLWGTDWLKLLPGNYSLRLGEVEGFQPPPIQMVTIKAGETTTVVAEFERLGQLTVILEPVVASTVHVDGVPMNDYTVRVPLLPGMHEVSFGDVGGFVAPPPFDVDIRAGVSTTVAADFRNGTARVVSEEPW